MAFALAGQQIGITVANVLRVTAVGLISAALGFLGIVTVFTLHRRAVAT